MIIKSIILLIDTGPRPIGPDSMGPKVGNECGPKSAWSQVGPKNFPDRRDIAVGRSVRRACDGWLPNDEEILFGGPLSG